MGTTRIAIVDDHALVRGGLARLLALEADFSVVGSCGDGAGALELAAALRPDVILLDIALPDVDGLDLIAKIRDRSPESRVLMLSMHSEPEYAAAAVARGARGLVAKSASAEALVEAIRRVAAGEILPSEERLSPREREILALVAAGRSNDEVAQELGIQRSTVDGHCERLMEKLDIHTRTALVAYGRRIAF
ncbi:MAG: response regulator transcription factor [Candidatus Bipolaricaulota bacterium]|nr:response regulator transcription factor [Candidatus Bipolaricaulota bacterium]